MLKSGLKTMLYSYYSYPKIIIIMCEYNKIIVLKTVFRSIISFCRRHLASFIIFLESSKESIPCYKNSCVHPWNPLLFFVLFQKNWKTWRTNFLNNPSGRWVFIIIIWITRLVDRFCCNIFWIYIVPYRLICILVVWFLVLQTRFIV